MANPHIDNLQTSNPTLSQGDDQTLNEGPTIQQIASNNALCKSQVGLNDYQNESDNQQSNTANESKTMDETLQKQEEFSAVCDSRYDDSRNSISTHDANSSANSSSLRSQTGSNPLISNSGQHKNTNGSAMSTSEQNNESHFSKVWLPSTSNPIIKNCPRAVVDDSGGTYQIHESPHRPQVVNSLNGFLPSQSHFPNSVSTNEADRMNPNTYHSMSPRGFPYNGNFMDCNAFNDHRVPFGYHLPEQRHTWPNVSNGLMNISHPPTTNPELTALLSPLNSINSGDAGGISHSDLMLLSALLTGHVGGGNIQVPISSNATSYFVPQQDIQPNQMNFSGQLNMPYEAGAMAYPRCQINPVLTQTGTMLDMVGTNADGKTNPFVDMDPNKVNAEFHKHYIQGNRRHSYIRPCTLRNIRPNTRRNDGALRRSMPPPSIYQHSFFPNQIPPRYPHTFDLSGMEDVINSLFDGQPKKMPGMPKYRGRSQINNEFPIDRRFDNTQSGYMLHNQFISNNGNSSSSSSIQDSSLRFPSSLPSVSGSHQTQPQQMYPNDFNIMQSLSTYHKDQNSPASADMLMRNTNSPISSGNPIPCENHTSTGIGEGSNEYCAMTLAGKTLALLPNVCKDSIQSGLRDVRYSRKVFVGGLPPDIDEEEIMIHFQRFGQLVVDWPHKAESKSYFPPKGYAFLIYSDERSVQDLIEACVLEDQKLYMCVSSPSIRDKPVQIRPWLLSDSDYVMDGSQPLDPRKTIFVGGVPRPLRAVELALIMNRMYGGVCYAGIDTDPELKYPKGAGRVAFSNQQSYITAISARFMQLRHMDIDKRVEVKPYVLDDQMCDECRGARCNGKFAPFFCANVTCLQYYCENCWTAIHCRGGREFHKPLVKEGSDRPRSLIYRWS